MNLRKFVAAMLSFALIFSLIVPINSAKGAVAVEVHSLKVNNITNPLGIDFDNLRFSWQLSSDEFAKSQSAYKIEVSKDESFTNKLWDSAKIPGGNNYDIAYGGTALSSKTKYFWRVTVWDETGTSVGTSETAAFETGMISSDWKAAWIDDISSKVDFSFTGANWIWIRDGASSGGVPKETLYFRKRFSVNTSKTVVKALAGVSADDSYKFYVNGEMVGENSGEDSWKSGKLYDITDLITGENTIAASAENASAGYAGFISKIEITYSDGFKDIYQTDNSWKVTKTEESGWSAKSHDDTSWRVPDQQVLYGGSPWDSQINMVNVGNRAAPMFRKEFDVANKTVAKARVYVSGLGMYDIKINGEAITDTVLNQSNTQYNKTIPYGVYDVTDMLKKGSKNAVGAELGNGFFNESTGVWEWQNAVWRADPKLLFQMEIYYTDGTSTEVLSGTDWQATSKGPTTANSIYCGESYDARLEKAGWDKAGYTVNSAWHAASASTKPAGILDFQYVEPMRRIDTYKPLKITKLSNGSYVIYAPKMTTGWIRLKNLKAAAGDEITVSYTEKISSDGSPEIFNSHWFGGIFQQDKYIAKGDAAGEAFEPRFSYKGFEYVRIDGYKGVLTVDDVEIYRIASDVAITGDISTSNSLINKMHELMVNTSLNNMQGKPTDTPVWEKNGWTGDANVSLQSMTYNFDMTSFLKYFEETMQDSQTAGGVINVIAPHAGFDWGNVPVWNSLYVLLVEQLADSYGMQNFISTQYDSMKKLADSYVSKSQSSGWTWEDGQLGDWVSPMGTNPDEQYAEGSNEGSGIVGSAYVYMSLQTMAKFAAQLGKTADAAKYTSAMASIKTAFNNKYLKKNITTNKYFYETTVWYNNGPNRTKYRQTSNIVPLMLGIVPDDKKQDVIDTLIKDIIDKGYHLDTGIIGTKYILPTLTDLGYSDVAYKILTQTTYPSWGYMALHGTSLWEMWENTTRSRAHYFLGTYDQYLYEYLAGVKDMKDGYKTFTLEPTVEGDLAYVNLSLDTVRGEVVSSWTLNSSNAMEYTVKVPVGSTAAIYMPTDTISKVKSGGQTVSSSMPGISSVAVENGKVKIVAQSGSYKFVSQIDGYTTDKTRLAGMIEETTALKQHDFTAEGWTKLQAALTVARAAQQNTGMSQIDIVAATNALESAIEALSDYLNEARNSLKETIAVADSTNWNPVSYNTNSWSDFEAALTSAKTIAESVTSTDAELLAANTRLQAAISFLDISKTPNLAIGAIPTARSYFNNGDWDISKLNDGNINIGGGYSSTVDNRGTDRVEWVVLDMGTKKTFDYVTIYPAADSKDGKKNAYGMPKRFVIESSDNGVDWTVVNNEYDKTTGKDYQLSAYGAHNFRVKDAQGESVSARYVRIYAQSLQPKVSDSNYYYLQLIEVEIYAIDDSVIVVPADKTALTAAYNRVKDFERYKYSKKNWAEFESAVSISKTILDSADVTQEQLNDALSALNTAESKLLLLVKGDVNGDGERDITDMQAVRNVLLGGIKDEDIVKRANVNGDSNTDITDIMAVLNILIAAS